MNERSIEARRADVPIESISNRSCSIIEQTKQSASAPSTGAEAQKRLGLEPSSAYKELFIILGIVLIGRHTGGNHHPGAFHLLHSGLAYRALVLALWG